MGLDYMAVGAQMLPDLVDMILQYQAGSQRARLGERFATEYGEATQEARSTNEARYQDILRGYGQREQLIRGYGQQEASDINMDYTNLGSRAGQDLVNRGLSSATIRPSVMGGIERQRRGSLGQLNDRIRGMQMNLQGERLGFMERREDPYPQPDALMAMYQGLGLFGGQ